MKSLMSIDVRMMILLSAILPILLGMMMFIYWRTRKTYPGFARWVAACFCIGFGHVLLATRNQIPDFFSIILGNVLLVYAVNLIYEGLQLFFERRPFDRWNYLILAGYILGQVYWTGMDPNLSARVVLISVVLTLLELRVGVRMLRGAPLKLRRTCVGIAMIFILSSLFTLLRGIVELAVPQSIDLLSENATVAMMELASVCAVTVWTFYFFFLNNARIEWELQESQQNLLKMSEADRHRVVQLGLLEETGRFLVESLDEQEILRRTVEAVVNRFGFAKAAISLLVEGNMLEVAAIGGTDLIYYRPGYRQKIGEGIIGATAEKKTAYIAADVEKDPYYFTIGERGGSAAGVPILNDGQLMGVLYVESAARNAFDPIDIQTLETLVSSTVTAIQKARLYQRVQDQLRAISTLQSVSHTILSSLELSQIFQSVVSQLKQVFNYTYVSIFLLEDQALRLVVQDGYGEDMPFYTIQASSGITGRCVREHKLQFVRDVRHDPDFLEGAIGIECEICVPLLKDDQVLGVLNVEEAPGHPLTDNDVAVLTALAGPIVVAIENARLHAQVKELAMTDGLTGLFNRRAFDQTLESEFERASRYDYPLALVMIDLDSFKEYNDHWGHPAGDERLKEIAEMLRADLRHPDVVARYGGDEFALILPHTDKARARAVAERLRDCASAQSHPRPGTMSLRLGYTFSMGIAVFPADAANPKELLFAADQAELAAKALGKNRICEAGER